MKTGTVTIVYLAFGILFLFNSISIFSISGTVDSPFSKNVSALEVLSLVNLAVSLLFFAFLMWTHRVFIGELFEEKSV
jgi:hypothetical protein